MEEERRGPEEVEKRTEESPGCKGLCAEPGEEEEREKEKTNNWYCWEDEEQGGAAAADTPRKGTVSQGNAGPVRMRQISHNPMSASRTEGHRALPARPIVATSPTLTPLTSPPLHPQGQGYSLIPGPPTSPSPSSNPSAPPPLSPEPHRRGLKQPCGAQGQMR
ncbi:hypothetical protein PAMP_023871 [Pampus punctatissimus]